MSVDTYKFENENHTFGNLIRSELLKDESVEFAAYKKTHHCSEIVELKIVSEDSDSSLKNAKESILKDVRKLKKGWNRSNNI